MSTRSLALAGLLAGATLSFAAVAEAATVTWDFADLTNTTEDVSGSGFGNVRTYTSDGYTIRVTALSRQLSGQEKFQDAQIARYSGYGLGVCGGSGEKANCGSPDHQVDNYKAFDFVLFEFLGGTIDPTGVAIETFNDADLDVSYYVGTGELPIELANLTVSDLASLGFEDREDDDYAGSADSRTVAIDGSTAATSLLFGASLTQTSVRDYFKIVSLTATIATPTPTPSPSPTPPVTDANEPASLGLLGAGLVGLAGVGAVRRRRKA